jgi:hypothetical protein
LRTFEGGTLGGDGVQTIPGVQASYRRKIVSLPDHPKGWECLQKKDMGPVWDPGFGHACQAARKLRGHPRGFLTVADWGFAAPPASAVSSLFAIGAPEPSSRTRADVARFPEGSELFAHLEARSVGTEVKHGIVRVFSGEKYLVGGSG